MTFLGHAGSEMLRLSFVTAKKAPLSLTQDEFTVEAATGIFTTYEVGEKDGLAVIPAVFKPCPSVCHNTLRRDRLLCSGGQWHRLGENVTHMTAIGIDLDESSSDEIALFLNTLDEKGLGYWFWHTHSHTTEVPKARVIVPFAEPLAISSSTWWRQFARPAVLKYLGAEVTVDTSTTDPSRLYFLPRKPTLESPHIAFYRPGAPLDVPPLVKGFLNKVPDVYMPVSPIEEYSPDLSRPVDLGALRERLQRIHKSPATPIVRKMLRGEPLTPAPDKRAPGEPSRYVAWRTATGVLAEVAELWMASEALHELLKPSWHAERKESPGDYTPWDTVETLLESARAAQPERKAAAAAEAARVRERNALMLRASTPKGTVAKPAIPLVIPEDEQAEETRHPFNDKGSGRMLLEMFKDTAAYVPEWGQWLSWDGLRWLPATDDYGIVLAMAVSDELTLQAAQAIEDGMPEELVGKLQAWANKSGNLSHLRGAVAAARPSMCVSAKQLDQQHYLLSVQNGTIDLRTGKLIQPQKEQWTTKKANVVYDPNATAPAWLRFMEQIQPDPEVRGYLQRAVGYSLTGDVTEECLFFCHGDGGNGKSTFFKPLMTLMGDYAATPVAKLLMRRHGETHSTEMMDLVGARLAMCSEISSSAEFSEETVKKLTSNEVINARRIGKDSTPFHPTHKLFMCSNPKPRVQETDSGIWRRVKLIPFTASFLGSERDPHLGEKLSAELSGILNWAIEGCLAWQRDGLQEPEAVRLATQEYREDEDALRDFINRRCIMQGEVRHEEMYRAYAEWADASRLHVYSPHKLSRELTARGFRHDRRGHFGEKFWVGVSLRPMGVALKVVPQQQAKEQT